MLKYLFLQFKKFRGSISRIFNDRMTILRKRYFKGVDEKRAITIQKMMWKYIRLLGFRFVIYVMFMLSFYYSTIRISGKICDRFKAEKTLSQASAALLYKNKLAFKVFRDYIGYKDNYLPILRDPINRDVIALRALVIFFFILQVLFFIQFIRSTQKITGKIINIIIEDHNEKERKTREMMSCLSHDIKSAISTTVDVLKCDDSEESKKWAEKSLLEVNRIMNEFSLFNKLRRDDIVEQLKKNAVVFDINEYLADYAVMLQISKILGQDVEIVNDVDKNPGYVFASKDDVQHVLINIINNTKKYSSCSKFCISTKNKPDYIIIRLYDNGIGLETPEEADTLFDPFTRGTKFKARTMDGEYHSGLGMNIIKTLVELDNGTVEYDKTLKKGFGIVIKLPNKEKEYKKNKEAAVA